MNDENPYSMTEYPGTWVDSPLGPNATPEYGHCEESEEDDNAPEPDE